MANTNALKGAVEDFIRDRLRERFGQPFGKTFLTLRTGGRHEFDAVAEDQSIVASIKATSDLTSGGNRPAGKIKDATAELYFLSLVDAPVRILILTDPAFHRRFSRCMDGRLADGVAIEHIALLPELQHAVTAVTRAASDEVTRRQPHDAPPISGSLTAPLPRRST